MKDDRLAPDRGVVYLSAGGVDVGPENDIDLCGPIDLRRETHAYPALRVLITGEAIGCEQNILSETGPHLKAKFATLRRVLQHEANFARAVLS